MLQTEVQFTIVNYDRKTFTVQATGSIENPNFSTFGQGNSLV